MREPAIRCKSNCACAFAKWLAAHANGVLGTSLAAVYPLLAGPRWLRGVIYVQGMWVVQALFVLPWLHQGYFGAGISRTAPLWSWGLNALYGGVLGALYEPKRAQDVTS
jgi:hypothetical protein